MSSSYEQTDRNTSRDKPNDSEHGRHDQSTGNATGNRKEVVSREQEEHGGIKVGSAFFGWLTATGAAVLLTALIAAAGAAVGLATGTDVDQATSGATSSSDTVGIASGVVLLVVLFIAYFCGGYVAGRMARFNGMKQGLAVWLWALVIAVVFVIVGAVAGDKYNVLARLNSFPRIPANEGDLALGGIIAAAAIALVSLIGALLGGLAGMRFHRKVDKTGLGR